MEPMTVRELLAATGGRLLAGREEDTITGVLDDDGRDIRASDLVDLSHEWHHVGKRFDEVLFLDPEQFPDVRTADEIEDKHTAALVYYYPNMRQKPREVDSGKLTLAERDSLNEQERAIWKAFGETVKPRKDAFVRAIAANEEVSMLRELGADN